MPENLGLLIFGQSQMRRRLFLNLIKYGSQRAQAVLNFTGPRGSMFDLGNLLIYILHIGKSFRCTKKTSYGPL
jgi:hypothetical protein